MRKLLIVSPHFPPVNGADMHRVRLSLPHFADLGWEPLVLAIRPEYLEIVQDPLLLETVPREIRVRHAAAYSPGWTRKLGVSAIGLRAWPFLWRMGAELIREHAPELIYFSTTAFPVMTLGRIWKKKFGIPFVLDLQDPWVSDYYEKKTALDRPPKYELAQRMHRTLEPYTMRAVDGLVAVSAAYHETLRRRYPWIHKSACRTIPFGASQRDFEVADKMEWRNPFFASDDGCVHGVYVGVLGRVMTQTCRAICMALRRGLETEPALFSKVRLHFIGTDYAPSTHARATIRPIAAEMGLQEFVQEDTNRLPYFSALRLLRAADFLLLAGSDNPDYTASKVYPYILSRKPLLAVFHRESSVVSVIESTLAGWAATFTAESSVDDIAQALLPQWTQLLRALPFTPDTDWNAFQPYTAREMTRRQCELFDQIVSAAVTKN